MSGVRVSITNNEEWGNLLKTPGLVLVDVHNNWCGPCTAMFSTFKKIFYEFQNFRVKLASANADNISALTKFRGRSRPLVLLFVDGKLTKSVVGVNLPVLLKAVKELAVEKPEDDAVAPLEAESAHAVRPISPPPAFIAPVQLRSSASLFDLTAAVEEEEEEEEEAPPEEVETEEERLAKLELQRLGIMQEAALKVLEKGDVDMGWSIGEQPAKKKGKGKGKGKKAKSTPVKAKAKGRTPTTPKGKEAEKKGGDEAKAEEKKDGDGEAAEEKKKPSKPIVVLSIEEGGAAERAGLQPLDIFVSANDNPIVTMDDIEAVLNETRPGTILSLNVLRAGESVLVEAIPSSNKDELSDETVASMGRAILALPFLPEDYTMDWVPEEAKEIPPPPAPPADEDEEDGDATGSDADGEKEKSADAAASPAQAAPAPVEPRPPQAPKGGPARPGGRPVVVKK